jgi:hypothetical protein
MLTPAASGMPAYGTTDQEGHFSLSSGPSRNGAGPGQYTAIVTLAKTSGIAVNSDQLEGEVSPGGIRIESIVPPKYSDPKTSGLSVDVQTGMPPLKFDLSTHQ